MDLLNFVSTIVLVTGSGALAPGPLFFANLSQGTRSGAKSGLVFSAAHTVVEFTLVMLLALGLLTFIDDLAVKFMVGVIGGIFLTAYGGLQIYGSLASEFVRGQSTDSQRGPRNLFLMGLAFTGLNPFFIVWWLTAGAQLILIALEFAAFLGVVFMYVCHVWMDYAWLTATAHVAKLGMKVAGAKWYRGIIAVFGAVLIFFGLRFFFSSFGLLN